MRKSRRSVTVLVGMVLIAVLIRVVLAYKTAICPGTDAVVDDRLFMNYANSIRQGDWVGTYGQNTLAKNPGYGILLAAFRMMGLRYQLGFVLLLCFACAVAARSLRPLVPSTGIRLAMFVGLLYMPAFFTSYFFQRVYRNGATIVVALLLFSSLIGLYLRRCERLRILVPWSLLAGTSLGFFSILQESAAWVLPFSCVCTLVTVALTIFDFRQSKQAACVDGHTPKHFRGGSFDEPAKGTLKRRIVPDTLARIFLVLLPLCIYATTIAGVSYVNQRFYGVGLLNDRYYGEFARATADLMKIDVGYDDHRVWVSNEALDKALEASPTLRQMEKEVRESWKVWQEISSTFNILNEKEEPQILGDHPYWALRDAYAAYGGFTSARESERFWGVIANEIEAAFDLGTLRKKDGLFLSATTQPMSQQQLSSWIPSSAELLNQFAWGGLLDETMILPLPDTSMMSGSIDDEMMARELLGNNTLFTVDGQLYEDRTSEIAQPWLMASRGVGKIVLLAQRILIIAALVGVVTLLAMDIRARNRDGIRSALILVGLYLSAYALVFGSSWMISFLSAGDSAVSAANPSFSYCGSLFALLGIFLCLVLGRLAQAGWNRVQGRALEA